MTDFPESWTEELRVKIRNALRDFYSKRKRDLPWRRSPTPYGILVSEFMLQQTRVETALPYYQRWMAQFPTLASLAAAPEAEVLAAWQGLGYYSRARNLLRAAREIVANYGGKIPSTLEELRSLPGIGPYTAGAVLSMAFGQMEPAVDGNLRRVLARLADDPAPTPGALHRWTLGILDPAAPGDSNQALMELGATVCTPRRARCEDCPLAFACRARRTGTVDRRPARVPPPPKLPRREVVVGLVTADPEPHLLLSLAPSRGFLGGLWRLPSPEPSVGETPEDVVTAWLESRISDESHPAGGLPPLVALPRVRRVFTHLDVEYHPFLLRLPSSLRPSFSLPPATQWIPLSETAALPISSAHRELLQAVQRALEPDALPPPQDASGPPPQ